MCKVVKKLVSPYSISKARKVIYIIDGQVAGCKEFNEGDDRERVLDDWLKGF